MLERDMAQKNLILKFVTGSYLYGTNTPSSDKDYVGVFVPTKDYVMGIKVCEQVEYRTNPSDSGHRNGKDDTDMTIYSLPKFLKLVAGNNPNIVELLFVPPQNIITVHPLGQEILDNAKLFVSKKCKYTFLGYAHSQKQKLITKNPEGSRMEYVEKYGYDVKFASHLIRLLSEGLQLLKEGRVTFPLSNAQILTDIKLGKYQLCDVLAEADRYETLIEEIYANSPLQYSADYEAINKFQIYLLEKFWNSNP